MPVRYKGDPQEEVFLWANDLVRGRIEIRKNYRFHPDRAFELDVAFPSAMLGIEVDGFGRGGHGGGHQSPKGFIRDREKDLEAACLGWRVIRVATAQVRDGRAFGYLERILGRYVLNGTND